MEKRATHLDRVNSVYAGETIYFATMHGKDELVAPLLRARGIGCQRVPIDTDRFGTFSGEIKREGSVLETLRRKISAAVAHTPQGRLYLASEGSFGPDPVFAIFQSDLESLLLWDRTLNLEIYAEHLCRSPRHAELTFDPIREPEKLAPFLEHLDLSDHGVIVHPEGCFTPIVKGLHQMTEVAHAIQECVTQANSGKVVVSTDLRAHHNKTRRAAIIKAAEALITKLDSRCPQCQVPGFAVASGIPGLPCKGCGTPSPASKALLWECKRCHYTEEHPRADGRTTVSPAECELCNP